MKPLLPARAAVPVPGPEPSEQRAAPEAGPPGLGRSLERLDDRLARHAARPTPTGAGRAEHWPPVVRGLEEYDLLALGHVPGRAADRPRMIGLPAHDHDCGAHGGTTPPTRETS